MRKNVEFLRSQFEIHVVSNFEKKNHFALEDKSRILQQSTMCQKKPQKDYEVSIIIVK